MVGKTLAHYEILERLGEGGMGEVYRARDTKLDRDVAIKVLPPELARDPERRARFEREAKAVAALKHPNIVTIHSVEKADGVHFITMELVEGKTLGDVIPPAGFDVERLIDLAVPLSDAISTAHVKGIAHRDLKPANVMLDSDGRVKVLDFGLAKLFESDIETDETVAGTSDTGEGRILGTVAYMSPEQAEGKAVDHRSDIFSLGILLYQMATGEKPFKGETRMSTLSSIIKDQPPSVTDIDHRLPRHLGRVINRCLAKEPDRRYQSALDVRNELEGLRAEIGSGEIEGGRRRPARRAVNTKLVLGGMFAALAVIVVVGVIALMPVVRNGGGPGVPRSSTGDLRSIAVLPFANLSGDPDNEYFSDGLAEELLNLLAKVPGLHVAARTSSFHFKGQTGNIKEIGDALNVATILEGSVRRAGNRVRVTAQLVKAEDGFHMWSDTFDRQLDDIFEIQEEIATQVVEAMKITLLGEDAARLARRPTDNMDAYDAYLLGQQRMARRRSDSLQEAVKYFQRAIDLDPHFALAYVGLAQAHDHLSEYGSMNSDDAIRIAEAALDKALELDDQLGEAQAVKGLVAMGRSDESAGKYFERAIELNPNYAMAYMWYALFMGGRDNNKRWELINKAIELDPLSAVANANVAYWLAAEGKTQESLERFQRITEIDPGFVAAYKGMAMLYTQHFDEPDKGLDMLSKAIEVDPGNIGTRLELGWTTFRIGRRDEALVIFNNIVKENPGYAGGYSSLAWANRNMGRFDEAVRSLRKAIDRNDDPEYYHGMIEFSLDLDDRAAAVRWLEALEASAAAPAVIDYYWGNIHVYDGDLDKAEERYRRVVEKTPSWVLREMSFFDIRDGRGKEARDRVAAIFPELFEPDVVLNAGNVDDAPFAAHLLRAAGEDARAEALVRKCEAFLAPRDARERLNRWGYDEAGLYLLRGDTDGAIAQVERVVAETNDLSAWWDRTDFILGALWDDPRLQLIIEDIRAEVAPMRESLEAEGLMVP